MKSLNLEEAADFLGIAKDTLRRKAAKKIIPGSKPGHSWLFIEEHLADWVSGRYAEPRELQVDDKLKLEVKPCQSISVMTRGGLKSPQKMAAAYKSALGLK